MPLALVTPPATEPLTRAEAKAHLRLEQAADDTLIDGLIVAVRQYCEAFTGRALITQAWKLTLPAFAECLDLPRPPLVAVASVKYLDAAGVEQTVAGSDYLVVNDVVSAYVTPAYGTIWPTPRAQADAVRIAYTAGYGDATAVPQALKQGMLIHLAQLYEQRDDTGRLPPAVEALYWAYRVVTFR